MTAELRGVFLMKEAKDEFYSQIQDWIRNSGGI